MSLCYFVSFLLLEVADRSPRASVGSHDVFERDRETGGQLVVDRVSLLDHLPHEVEHVVEPLGLLSQPTHVADVVGLLVRGLHI